MAIVVLTSTVAAPAWGQGTPAPDLSSGPKVASSRSEDEQRMLEETLALAPTDVPSAPDDVFVDVVTAKEATVDAAEPWFRAQTESQDADQSAADAAAAVVTARAKVDAAVTKRDETKAKLAKERERLSALTVRAYVNGGDVSNEELRGLVEGDTSDPSEGRKVIFGQVLDGQQQIVDDARTASAEATSALARTRTALEDDTATSDGRAATARRKATVAERAKGAYDDAKSEQTAAELRLRSGPKGQLVPEGVAIIGRSRLSAEDLATWFEASPYRPRVATPIIDYARWFIAEGDAEGIRGDIAFAQAVLETGGFTNTDSVLANNYSGIGHCDLCPAGWRFPTPQMGVRAQIQLLKSYAAPRPQYINDLVDRRLRGPAGCCDTWGDLTTVWATDPGYGPKVMLLYTSMVDHALNRRANGDGFDDPAPPLP